MQQICEILTTAERERMREIFGRELTRLEHLIQGHLHKTVEDDFTAMMDQWFAMALDYWCAVEAFEERAQLKKEGRAAHRGGDA